MAKAKNIDALVLKCLRALYKSEKPKMTFKEYVERERASIKKMVETRVAKEWEIRRVPQGEVTNFYAQGDYSVYHEVATKEEAFSVAAEEFVLNRISSGKPTKKPFEVQVMRYKWDATFSKRIPVEVYRVKLEIVKK